MTSLPEYEGRATKGGRIDQLVLRDFLENEYKMHFEAERIAASAIRAIAPSVAEVMRTAARLLVRAIAACPEELFALEWRDLERVLYETLDGLGYEVILTRPGKDGGYDLQVVHRRQDGGIETYLIEVKHWALPAKVGTGEFEYLIEVVLREGASGGLLLSTSGFRPSLLRSRTRIRRKEVRLGSAPKIIQLCRSYEQVDGGPWIARSVGPDMLFQDTF
ncbi:restriction endonuclease [Amycolatopsis sp. WGS_07]|uniref:restriction endonuclease n=1 Tax=Amycolatopsis sp. WGS_07 TaxID=3076764 RepID=UPI0038739703